MNNIPVIILDNFLDNPKGVRDFALNLSYNPAPQGTFPGKRSDFLDQVNYPLFNFLSKKILSLFTPLRKGPEDLNIQYRCAMNFQLIESEGSGWVHQDPNTFTSILYLNEEEDSINCGTSFYNLKSSKAFPFLSKQEYNLSEKRLNHYQTGKISKELEIQKNKFNEETYDKILDIPNKFNRLVAFSSEMFHSANFYSNFSKTPRLTLVCFFDFIHSDFLMPIQRSKMVPMI